MRVSTIALTAALLFGHAVFSSPDNAQTRYRVADNEWTFQPGHLADNTWERAAPTFQRGHLPEGTWDRAASSFQSGHLPEDTWGRGFSTLQPGRLADGSWDRAAGIRS